MAVSYTHLKEKASQAKENQSVNPFPSVPIPSERPEQPPTLLELLNRAYTEAAKPQSRYGKIQDLKLYAKAFNFLQSRNITTLVQLQEVVSDMKKQYWTTNGEIKQTEKLLYERKDLIDQAEKYLEHRPTYKAYMQTKPKKQEDFFESNRAALTLYQSAERYLKEHLGEDKVLKPKAWKMCIRDRQDLFHAEAVYQPAVKGKDRHAHSGAERTGKTEIAEDRQMRAFWGRSALHTPYSNSILRSRKPQKVLGYIYLLIMPFALFEGGEED